MLIDVGETWSSPTYEVKDANGAYADAGTVTAIVTLPDGTTVAGTVAHPAAGRYTVDYLTTVEGLHEILVTATGGVLGALNRQWRESFTVERARLLVNVEEAIEYLRGQDVITEASDRETLRWFCQVATEEVERDLARVFVRRTFTEYFNGGCDRLKLKRVPPRPVDGGLITIGSVTENGAALSPATGYFLTADYELYRGSKLAPTSWFPGIEGVVVTYTSSCSPIPDTVRRVALNGVAAMWQSTQQSAHRAYDDIAGEASFASTSGLTPYQAKAYGSLRKRRFIG